jgi:transposase InsO family protein
MSRSMWRYRPAPNDTPALEERLRALAAARVVEVLRRLVRRHGAPAYLRSDNGPEFVARRVQLELAAQGLQAYHIQPGSPWENAFGESFNGRFRDECLNVEVYDTVREAQVVHERFRRHDNTKRPHSSLDYRTTLLKQGFTDLPGINFSPSVKPSSLSANSFISLPRQNAKRSPFSGCAAKSVNSQGS